MERRQITRIPWRAKVKVVEPTTGRVKCPEARLRNISKFGFGLVSEDAPARANDYVFEMDLDGLRCRIPGRVVHIKQEQTYYVIGVKIADMSFGETITLNRLLARQSPAIRNKLITISIASGAGVAIVLKLVFGLSIFTSALILAAVSTVLFLFPLF